MTRFCCPLFSFFGDLYVRSIRITSFFGDFSLKSLRKVVGLVGMYYICRRKRLDGAKNCCQPLASALVQGLDSFIPLLVWIPTKTN